MFFLHAKSYQKAPEFFDKSLVHLHVPEGQRQKMGQVLVSLCNGLIALARNEPVAQKG